MRRAMERLTDLEIKAFKVPEGKVQADLTDGDVRGLTLRVYSSGRRTWRLRYATGGGDRNYRLGEYGERPALTLEAARKEARALIARIDKGEDPQTQRRAARQADRVAETFGELAEQWLQQARERKRPRSYAEDVRKLKVEVLPHWSDRKLIELRRRDVLHLLERIKEQRGGTCSNRTRSLISAILNYAVAREIIPYSPSASVPKLHAERPRERVLTRDEMATIWRTLDTEHPVIAAAWRLILLTGQRPGEVMGMTWADLSKDEAGAWWWQIRGAVAKSGTGHRVPLSSLAAEIIDELRPLSGSTPWVLSYRDGKPLRWLHTSGVRLRSISGLAHFTPHDLRRTAATWLGQRGIRPDVIDALLGHTLPKITRTYNRASYDPEKRQAVSVLATIVQSVLEPRSLEATVVPFPGRAL